MPQNSPSSTFLTVYYRHMYHFPKPKTHMDSLLYATNSNVVTRDVVMIWVNTKTFT